MKTEITAEERRLIDEAIDAGRVRRIPAGERAFKLYDMTYNGRNLVYADRKVKFKGGYIAFTKRGARRAPKGPA